MTALLNSFLKDMRMSKVSEHIKGDVLDIGCGSCDLLSYMDQSCKYVGIELSNNKVSILKKLFPQHTFLQINIENGLGLNNGIYTHGFDTIALVAVIEHISDPNPMLRDIYELLHIGGKLIITTPTPFGDKVHTLGAMVGLSSKSAVHNHVNLYSKAGIYDLLESYDFKKITYRTFFFGLNQLIIAEK